MAYSFSISATTLDARLKPVASWTNRAGLLPPAFNSAVTSGREALARAEGSSRLYDDSVDTASDSTESDLPYIV